MAKLGEVCTIVSGSTPKTSVTSYWDGNIKWITPAELNEDTFYIMDSVRHITEEGKEKTGLSYLPTGTVILSSRAPIGKTAIAGCEMCCNQGFKNLICSDAIYNEYLYFFLKSKTDYLNSLGRGATFKEISKSIVENIEIPLPEVNQQKEIAEKFKKLEQLISLRKQQLAKLDELVKARFVEMFEDSVANTKNFPSTTLETVMTVFPQNGLYKPQTDYVQDDTGIPILRIDAFYNGKVTNWNTLKRLICSETEIDRYLLKENDIVINRVNSIEYLGKCAHIVGLKEKTVFESNMMRFHMDEKKVNAVYVTEVLCTEDIYRQILRRAKKSVNQASINQEDVKSLEILVPPLSLQNQFAAFVERVDKQKQTVQQSLEKLELMKKALMQEYFG